MIEETKERLLAAAYQVLAGKGAAGLTLDAVAAKAGVSKGGVLYHFRTKDMLFEQMLLGVIATFQRELDELEAAESPSAGRFLRAYLRASMADLPEEEERMYSAIIGMLALDPGWARVYGPAVARWRERAVKDGLEPGLALGLMAAADGWGMWAAMGARVVQPELRAKALAAMLRVATVRE